MPKQNVTIIDQNGSLLSQGNSDVAGRLSDSELEYRMRLENIYRMRIVSLVTPIVGAGNVNAQVNLDIDFTRSELTERKKLTRRAMHCAVNSSHLMKPLNGERGAFPAR